MNPTFSARTRFRSVAEMLATFSPSSQISPEVGRSRQPIRFTRVDLPEPDGPMTATHSPGSTVSVKLSRARMTPPLASALAGYSRLTLFSLIISLASQNHSRLNPTQQGHRHHRREQRHRHTARKDYGEDTETGHHGRVEVYPADPGSDSYSNSEPDHSSHDSQRGGFGGKESADQALGSAQGFHDGKIAAAIKNPSDQRGQHAKRGGQDDQDGGNQQCGTGLAEHAGLTFHDLAHGAHFGGGQCLS